jgi:hypothetical protein
MKKYLFILFLILADTSAEGSVTVTYTFSANTLIVAAQFNSNFTDVLSGINNVATAQIEDEAVITSKIADDAVTIDKLDAYIADGVISGASGIDWGRQGDIILSSNTSAPAGFSDVSSTYGNKFIRISTDTPLQTGGGDTHIHSTGSHTLTTDEIPAHSHTVATSANYAQGTERLTKNGTSALDNTSTSSVGGGASHNHGNTNAGSNVPAYVKTRMYMKD